MARAIHVARHRRRGGRTPAGGYIQPGQHIENPASKWRLRNLVEVSGLLAQLTMLPVTPAARAEAAAVHHGDYLELLARLSADRGGDAGENAPFGQGGYDIALLSAGGAIGAASAVMTGTAGNAYALIRPPGHHAERDRGRGFCLLNNIAIAAQAMIQRGLARRIAVVDWDVHHGNGTEQIFYCRVIAGDDLRPDQVQVIESARQAVEDMPPRPAADPDAAPSR
jgi:acetoin utilization deacetylase AcuC-like enzyme